MYARICPPQPHLTHPHPGWGSWTQVPWPTPFEDFNPFEDINPFEDLNPSEDLSPLEDLNPFEDLKPFEDFARLTRSAAKPQAQTRYSSSRGLKTAQIGRASEHQ